MEQGFGLRNEAGGMNQRCETQSWGQRSWGVVAQRGPAKTLLKYMETKPLQHEKEMQGNFALAVHS